MALALDAGGSGCKDHEVRNQVVQVGTGEVVKKALREQPTSLVIHCWHKETMASVSVCLCLHVCKIDPRGGNLPSKYIQLAEVCTRSSLS